MKSLYTLIHTNNDSRIHRYLASFLPRNIWFIITVLYIFYSILKFSEYLILSTSFDSHSSLVKAASKCSNSSDKESEMLDDQLIFKVSLSTWGEEQELEFRLSALCFPCLLHMFGCHSCVDGQGKGSINAQHKTKGIGKTKKHKWSMTLDLITFYFIFRKERFSMLCELVV